MDATHLLRLITTENHARAIADIFFEHFDPDETAIAAFEDETAGGLTPPWLVEVYFREPPDESFVTSLVKMAAGESVANQVTFATLQGQDWVKASLDGLKPVQAGRFVIHGSHDREKLLHNKINIEIEAALAFGTGHHGTTFGCLRAIDLRAKHTPRPKHILDLGTGTGILAMAAARAWRMNVVASDIDPVSTLTTRENAIANHCGAFIYPFTAAGVANKKFGVKGKYDFVLANILPKPLVGLATSLIKRIAPGGILVLSGIIPPHANFVINSYSARGMTLIKKETHADWVTLTMFKP